MSTTDPDLPAWLTAKVDQRLAMFEQVLGGQLEQLHIVMAPLSEPDEDASPEEFEQWDRTCDNCGRYCKEPLEFYTGGVVRYLKDGQPVHLTFGVCKDCSW